MTDPTPAVPEVPAAAEVPAVPAAAAQTPAVPAGAGAVATTAAAAPRKGRGLGIFALVLGILGVLGDLMVAIALGAQIASLAGGFEWTSLLTAFLSVAFLGFIAFFGGLVVGGLALLLGIIAAVKNRGRVAGVFGAILGFLVLGSHLIILILIAAAGSAVSGVPGVS